MRLGRLQRQNRRAFRASAVLQVSTSELAGWCWAPPPDLAPGSSSTIEENPPHRSLARCSSRPPYCYGALDPPVGGTFGF
jgi:hypothetical protein